MPMQCNDHINNIYFMKIITSIALATWLLSTSYSFTLNPSLAKIMAQLLPMRPEPTIPIFSFFKFAMALTGTDSQTGVMGSHDTTEGSLDRTLSGDTSL